MARFGPHVGLCAVLGSDPASLRNSWQLANPPCLKSLVFKTPDRPARGVDASFAAAANELGVTNKAPHGRSDRYMLPHCWGYESGLFLGGADLCIAIHSRIAACPKTLNCVQQALQSEIPTYGIENVHATPGGSDGIQSSGKRIVRRRSVFARSGRGLANKSTPRQRREGHQERCVLWG